MNETKVTKQHVFNFELKYRHLLEEYITNEYMFGDGLTVHMINDIVYDVVYAFTDVIHIPEFLEDYKDLINWRRFLRKNTYWVCKNLDKTIEISNKYLDNECWSFILNELLVSGRYHSIKQDEVEGFLKKYKDVIDWSQIVDYSFFNFSLDFILEMRDYLDIYKLIYENDGDFKSQMVTYVEENLETVIKYKREENVNG